MYLCIFNAVDNNASFNDKKFGALWWYGSDETVKLSSKKLLENIISERVSNSQKHVWVDLQDV